MVGYYLVMKEQPDDHVVYDDVHDDPWSHHAAHDVVRDGPWSKLPRTAGTGLTQPPLFAHAHQIPDG